MLVHRMDSSWAGLSCRFVMWLVLIHTADVLVSIPVVENGQFFVLYLIHNKSLFYFELGLFIERKQNMIRILCLHSFSVLHTHNVKVYWILRNPLYSLCGTSLPTLCTRFHIWMGTEGVWLLANTFAISRYLFVDGCSVHCKILFASILLWSFIYSVPAKWKNKKQQILYIRMEKKEWLGVGIALLSASHPFFRQSV